MPTTIDAVYEKGVMSPKCPVVVREGEEVGLTVAPRGALRSHALPDAQFTALASEEALASIRSDPAEDEARDRLS